MYVPRQPAVAKALVDGDRAARVDSRFDQCVSKGAIAGRQLGWNRDTLGRPAMFRVKASEIGARIPSSAAIVLTTLVLASVLSLAAVFQVLEEYRLLGDWLASSGPVSAAEIRALRRDIGTRIIVRSTALAALMLCTVATLWLQQRQLAIRRTLNQIKIFARDILASMDQGVITTDLNGMITSVNSAAIEVLGMGPECVGQPLAQVSGGGAPLAQLASEVADRDVAIWDRDFSIEHGGRTRRIRAHGQTLKSIGGGSLGCLVLLRDVSDRLLIEERMRRMERFISLGTLASGLHHEIKNPLTALSIHVQLLDKRLRDPEPRKPVDEMIGVLKTEVHRLNGVLESFHDFASLRSLVKRPTDICAVLEEIIRLFSPQAEQQGVRINLRQPEMDLPRVMLDAEKFKQAILNLVINALEAMPSGGELFLNASTGNGELLIEVADTGSGIPVEIQHEVFRPYFSTKDRGTGMGLALTEKLIGQHEGRIDLKSGPGGTAFTIAVPLAPGMNTNGDS
jgi:two-component system, NtrC family, sensor histidine kinase HydH